LSKAAEYRLTWGKWSMKTKENFDGETFSPSFLKKEDQASLT